jgi:hypothetical protein
MKIRVLDTSRARLASVTVLGLALALGVSTATASGTDRTASADVSAMACATGSVKGFATIRGYSDTPTTYTSDSDYIFNSYNCAGPAPQVRLQGGVWYVWFPNSTAQISTATPSQYYYGYNAAEYGRPSPGVFGIITAETPGYPIPVGFNIVVY